MRRRWKSTRRRRDPGESVSLFPFLAVLICTMGALILLLVVIARQARLQAARAEEAEIAQGEKKIAREEEFADWMIDELVDSRQVIAADLAEARAKLGHFEEHTNRLRRRLEELRAAWADLASLQQNQERGGATSQGELAQLTAAIDRLKGEIARTKKEYARQPRSYAVVPYQGPHATRRRPIYLECRADSVVIQPEGIAFGEDDFNGPLDSGNPLDAALRAVREYLVRQQERLGAAEGDELYPLLLVRPSGIGAYYAARTAMKSWGTEFGYELIGEDWPLAFQPPDPELAQAVRVAADVARRQQQLLATMTPSRFDPQQRPFYRVSPHRGGAIRQGGSDEDDSRGFLAGRPAGRFGQRAGSSTPRAAAGPGRGASSPGATPAAAGSRSEDSAPAEPGRPGGKQPGAGPTAAEIAAGAAGSPRKLAAIRGRDWGLPDASARSVPVTRPIRIECYGDRLVVGPAAGPFPQQIVPVSGRIEPSIDTFVSSIWDYMELWGIAGRGMYWRPVLNVYVGPQAEGHFRELEILLEDSGLEVRRAGSIGGP